MLSSDDDFYALEITIVSRPFILDFALAYLDTPPEFAEEVWLETLARWQQHYEFDWPRVEAALFELKQIGIHFLDVHPGNIALYPKEHSTPQY